MELIILEGESGSGKTTALRNLPVDQTFIITPNGKPLSWSGGTQAYGKRIKQVTDLKEIGPLIPRIAAGNPEKGVAPVKYIIIEDFSHAQNLRILSPKFVADGQAGGNAKYERYAMFGRDVNDNIIVPIQALRDKPGYVILINHTRPDGSTGRQQFKTEGKMIGNTIDPVSYARIVFHSMILAGQPLDKRYVLLTHDDGLHEAKSPMGMFTEDHIPNDLLAALERVHAYDNPVTTTS